LQMYPTHDASRQILWMLMLTDIWIFVRQKNIFNANWQIPWCIKMRLFPIWNN
jgi:SppA_67K: signal peptide peptidase SppA, 67K type